jgi:hypothetical protein
MKSTVAKKKQTPLPVTPRKESPVEEKPSTFAAPRRWFVEYRIKIAQWVLVALICLGSSYWNYRSVNASKQDIWIWHVDDNGSMTYAPARLADPNSNIFQEICMQAASAYLTRNTKGLSLPEMVRRFFDPKIGMAIDMEVRAEAEERERRNLFDQVEITKTPELISAEGGGNRYRVLGYIKRTGNMNGLPEQDVGEFRLNFILKPNVNVTNRGRFPYVVSQYIIDITWRGSRKNEIRKSDTPGRIEVTQR